MKSRRSIRPFSLLEVLIALTIVSFCAVPLITPHFTIAKNEAEALRHIEFELQAKKAFEEVREMLYRNPWWHGNAKPPSGQIGEAHYAVSIPKKYKKGKDQHYRTYRLLDVAITIGDETTHFKLVAEKVKA